MQPIQNLTGAGGASTAGALILFGHGKRHRSLASSTRAAGP